MTLDDSGLAVPVLSDGVLPRRPRPRSFDEVLKGLRQFPEPPDADEEEDYTERTDGTGPRPPGVTAGSPLDSRRALQSGPINPADDEPVNWR